MIVSTLPASQRILIRTASKRVLIRTVTLQNGPTASKRVLIRTATTATTIRKATDPNFFQKNCDPNCRFAKWTNCPQKNTDLNYYYYCYYDPKEYWSELHPKEYWSEQLRCKMYQLHPKEHWPELILLLIRSERILIPTASKRILIRTATLQNAPTDPKGILIKTTSTTATTARKNTDPNCLQKNARPNSYFAKWDNWPQKNTDPNY